MLSAEDLTRSVWFGAWRAMQRYHRYSIEGIEHLDHSRSMLIVGYHGRPFAWDLCMLMTTLHDRLGYAPHGVVHRGLDAIPPLRWLVTCLGAVVEDDETIVSAIERGEHVIVTPGGTQEGCRSYRDRYRVNWGERLGYLRLALKYRLPIVPVASDGVDDTYLALTNGPAIGRWLGLPRDWEWLPWLGVGPLGIFPLSPPFPVRFRQLIGAPIDLAADGWVDANDRSQLLTLHAKVIGEVQSLLDRARVRAA